VGICESAKADNSLANIRGFARVEDQRWKIAQSCATVLSMRSVRRPQSRSRTGTGRGVASQGASKLYRARRRPGFLTVSEGERSATIMVGPLRGPEHRELIHRARFYHVPVSAIAASRASVDYIAFYEGASRFHNRTGVIREYARVVRVSRMRRCDLPGLTWPSRGAPDALYFRFDLGPIQELPRPITNPDRLRIAFRFPDLERFQEAETLRHLRGSGLRDRKLGKQQKGSDPTSREG